MLAIIGGSGFYYLGRSIDKIDVITPFGHAVVHKAKLHNNEEILFLPRHGEAHAIPPHKVNYRANIYALKKLGTRAIFATYAAGILNDYKIGDLILLEDFIGVFSPYQSFFNDFSAGMKHVEMNEPFDSDLQNSIMEIASVNKIKIKRKGIIVTTQGPRFETKAEVAFLKKTGANLVNMTSSYEISLAKEAEIPFAALAIATNFGAGLTKKAPNTEEVLEQTNKARDKVNVIVNGLVDAVE